MHPDLQKETLKQLMKGKNITIDLGTTGAGKTELLRAMAQRIEVAQALNPSIKFGTLTIN